MKQIILLTTNLSFPILPTTYYLYLLLLPLFADYPGCLGFPAIDLVYFLLHSHPEKKLHWVLQSPVQSIYKRVYISMIVMCDEVILHDIIKADQSCL